MSRVSEAWPVSPSETENPAAPPAADAPACENEAPRHPFNVEDEDWKNTPPKVQGVVVDILNEVERCNEIISFLLADN